MRAPRRMVLPFALVLLAAALVALLVPRLSVGDENSFVVYAEFRDLAGLRKSSDVKVAGVKAGVIGSLELTGRDTALARLELRPEAAPVGAGASARVRPVNLLGEKFVELDVGDLSKPVPQGSRIPLSRTSTTVELDDVLNMLDPNTRALLRLLINEAGIGLLGRGNDLNRLLEELPPSLHEVRGLLAELGADNRALQSAVEHGDRFFAEIDRERANFGEFVESAAGALEALAARRGRLGQTVATAPGALVKLRGTLRKLRRTSTDLRPAMADLRVAAGPLAATLHRLPSFQRSATGTLAALETLAPKLGRLGDVGAPVLQRLAPTATKLDTFTTELRPFVDTLDRGAMTDFMRIAEGWSSTIAPTDALGRLFRLRLVFSKELFESTLARYGTIAAAALRSTPRAAAASDPTLLDYLVGN